MSRLADVIRILSTVLSCAYGLELCIKTLAVLAPGQAAAKDT